jgi:hypothetical protein
VKVTDLIQFGKKVIQLVDDYAKGQKIEPPTRTCIRHFPTELEISETSVKTSFSSEIVNEPWWAQIVFDFFEKKIKPMPEFSRLAQSIAKTYKHNILTITPNADAVSQSTFWLEMFTQRLIYERLEGSFTENSLIEYASLFKSELELAPTEYTYVHYLDGLFLEMEKLAINDNVLLRKVRKEDLEYKKDILFDIPSPRYMDMGPPSSIMEVNISAKDERDCYEYTNRIISALRMYKLGSIYSKETISTRKTTIWPSGLARSSATRRYYPFRKYTLKETEANEFIDFVNMIEQKLAQDKEEKERRVLDISINRYNSALLESGDVEIRLMTAVMGLESLLTLEKDRGENAYKLGIRVAKILGYLNFDVEEARQLTEEAYDYRNKVVHGSFIPQTTRGKMNDILPHILDYLRVSLVLFILQSPRVGKNKLVDMIDRSAISEKRSKELQQLLKKDVEKFKSFVLEQDNDSNNVG